MWQLNPNEQSDTGFLAEVGQKAPDFALQNEKNESWRLSDHLGKVVALLFYPKDETLICTRQLCSLRDHWNEYLETKAVIVGVSRAEPEEHRRFAEKYELPINLLADRDGEITRLFGHHSFLPWRLLRTVVVVDAKGIIRSKQTMPFIFRPSDRQVITEILRARADALSDQYENLLDQSRQSLKS